MAKLILTNEVTGLGSAGDVVEVKNGYARNYLLPRNVAIRWTKGGEKDVEQIRRGRRIREIATIEQANDVKAQLEGVKVRLKTVAPEKAVVSGKIHRVGMQDPPPGAEEFPGGDGCNGAGVKAAGEQCADGNIGNQLPANRVAK